MRAAGAGLCADIARNLNGMRQRQRMAVQNVAQHIDIIHRNMPGVIQRAAGQCCNCGLRLVVLVHYHLVLLGNDLRHRCGKQHDITFHALDCRRYHLCKIRAVRTDDGFNPIQLRFALLARINQPALLRQCVCNQPAGRGEQNLALYGIFSIRALFAAEQNRIQLITRHLRYPFRHWGSRKKAQTALRKNT